MIKRNVETDTERDMLHRLIDEQAMPFNIRIDKGKARSLDQNALQWRWMGEISRQMNFETPDHAQAHCKLHYGVPILRRDDDSFREKYDRLIKPRPYEEKIELMMFAFPVTSLMTTKQMTEYFDTIGREMAKKGAILTQPEH